MKRAVLIILIALAAALMISCSSVRADGNGGASDRAASELADKSVAAEKDGGDVDKNVDDLLDKLDLTAIQSLLLTLTSDQIAVFGFDDIAKRIRAVASGEYQSDIGGILGYCFALLGADIFEFLPMMISCIAIVLAYNVINSVKSKFASNATERVVYFATGTLAVALIVGYFSSTAVFAVKFVASVKTQINAVAPVLLTVMTASGAASSAGSYSPAVAILGSGMTNIVTYIAFPALLMGLVFDVIGSISTGIKLEKTSEFLRSACKWFLSTAFFVFVTFVSVSGITASVRDGISVRVARFAVSKYVPVIGGYLSQGFDFVMAGNVLIKNAVGSSAVVLLVLCAAPVISKLAVFTLTLKLTAAIAEPLGGSFGGILTSVSKSSSVIAAVVAAMTFLYVLFLSIVIGTGNMAL